MPFRLPRPIGSFPRQSLPKFYKEDNYRESNFLGEKAFLITLNRNVKLSNRTTMVEGDLLSYDDVQEAKDGS